MQIYLFIIIYLPSFWVKIKKKICFLFSNWSYLTWEKSDLYGISRITGTLFLESVVAGDYYVILQCCEHHKFNSIYFNGDRSRNVIELMLYIWCRVEWKHWWDLLEFLVLFKNSTSAVSVDRICTDVSPKVSPMWRTTKVNSYFRWSSFFSTPASSLTERMHNWHSAQRLLRDDQLLSTRRWMTEHCLWD